MLNNRKGKKVREKHKREETRRKKKDITKAKRTMVLPQVLRKMEKENKLKLLNLKT